MNNKLTYILVGAAIGGIAVWVIMSTTLPINFNGMMNSNSNQRGIMSSNMIDAHFIEQMIPHHEDAITMAKLAPQYSNREEIKQLSLSIIESQGKEIALMKKWYQEWFGRAVPTGTQVMGHHGMMGNNEMHMGMSGDESDITRLTTAPDFDVAFIEHMIPHHQMAVMMASMLKTSTQRPEMKKLADDIITAQTKEIDQMRGWLKEWQ